MEKYRIVPENCKRLGQLLAGMEQTAQEGKLLDAAVIRHVEVTPARNMWELLIWSLDKLPEELLDRGRDYVTAKHDLQEVRFYTTVIKLEKVLEQKWEQLVEFVTKGDHAAKVILDQSRRVYGQNAILLQVQGDFAKYLLEKHKVQIGRAHV